MPYERYSDPSLVLDFTSFMRCPRCRSLIRRDKPTEKWVCLACNWEGD